MNLIKSLILIMLLSLAPIFAYSQPSAVYSDCADIDGCVPNAITASSSDALSNKYFTDNVGIGTTIPQYKLDVFGDINASGNIMIGGGSLCRQDGTNCPTVPVSGWTDGGTNIYLSNTADNVGVGTITPTAKLHVVGDSIFSGEMNVGGSGSNIFFENDMYFDGTISRKLEFGQSNGTYNSNVIFDVDTDSSYWNISSDSTTPITYAKLNSMGLVVSGNVAIGTITPSSKLAVVGTVTATSFVGDGSGLTGIASGSSAWVDGGTNVYVSPTTDNVAIGTTTPTEKLTVVGNISATAFSGSGASLTGITASGLATDSVSADELNATGVEAELEAVMDLQDMQGAVTDAQVPNTITVDLATTATTANAGDSATAFFTSGAIERARGGTAADTSAYGAGLLGSDGSNNTIDVDTIAEIETAIGGSTNILTETEIDASSELIALMDDETGTGALVFAGGDIGAATATTPSGGDNDTSVATTAYVQTEISGLSAGAGGWSDGGTNVYTTTTTDTVGIGTTGASGTLEIVKQGSSAPLMVSATATGDGNYLIVTSDGNVGIGTTLPNTTLRIGNRLFTVTSTGNVGIGAGDTNAHSLTIQSGGPSWTVASANTGSTFASPYLADNSSRTGWTFTSSHQNFSGNITSIGLDAQHTSADLGSSTSIIGLRGGVTQTDTANTVPNMYGVYGANTKNGSGGTITNSYGLFGTSATVSAGTITNNYALGASGKSVFSGNVGIGTALGDSYLTVSPSSGGLNVYGNVGIGTYKSSTKLDVVGGARITGLVSCDTIDTDSNGVLSCGTDDSSGASAWVDGGTNVYLTATTDNVGIGTTTPSTTLEIVKQGSSAPLMVSATATGDGNYLIVNSAGNVGIGTVLPRGTLDIGPSGTLYAGTIQGGSGPTILGTGNNVGIGTITAGSLLTIGSTGQATVSSAGAIATSSTVSVADDAYAAGWNGSTAVPTKNAVYDKIETIGGGASGWTDGGAFVYATTSSDNFGIGTSAPSNRLQIRGSSASNISSHVVNSDASGVSSFIAENNTGKAAQLACTGGSYAVPNLCGMIVTTGDNFTIAEADGTQNVTISGTGNVGIGSTAPNGSLDIRNTTSAIGWSIVNSANQACNTTCTAGCVFGFNTGSLGSLLACTDSTADSCLCAGSN